MKSTLKINAGKFSKTVGDAVESLANGSLNRKRIDSELWRATQEVVHAIEVHPVSQEIADGPKTDGKSEFLGGYGDLFSFIGFEAGTNPIAALTTFIYRKENEFRISQVTRSGTTTVMKISSPKMTDIWRETPLPWASGRSWVKGIEEGISNLGTYMNTEWQKGNSKAGFQLKTKISSRPKDATLQSTSTPTKYVSEIIRGAVTTIVDKITQDIVK